MIYLYSDIVAFELKFICKIKIKNPIYLKL